MDPEHEDDLKHTLPKQRLFQVKGPVHYHGPELDQQHHQEGLRDLVFGQGLGDVGRSGVFLKLHKSHIICSDRICLLSLHMCKI